MFVLLEDERRVGPSGKSTTVVVCTRRRPLWSVDELVLFVTDLHMAVADLMALGALAPIVDSVPLDVLMRAAAARGDCATLRSWRAFDRTALSFAALTGQCEAIELLLARPIPTVRRCASRSSTAGPCTRLACCDRT